MSFLIHTIHVMTCIAIIAAVLLQTSKSEGLSGTLGGKTSSTLGIKVGYEKQLEVITQYVAIAFLVVSFLAAWLT
jgi:preprotein translocase subunit SecG